MAENTPAKVYIFGSIGRKQEISELFKSYKAKNPNDYKFGDPDALYFIDKHNNINVTYPDTNLYYVITNSSDWHQLELKQSKKTRKFIVSIKEGSPSCDGCELGKKCTDSDKQKCEFTKRLHSLVGGPELSGKNISIEDVTEPQE